MSIRYFLTAAVLLLLVACRKSDSAPRAITTGFGQNFALQYRQDANLPQTLQPELTVRVTDLQFSLCPTFARCVAPDFAAPTLAITAADGSQQQLQLGSNFRYATNPAWIDSASVRANGRRYVVYYTSWQLAPGRQDNATKQDFTLNLRLEKPE